MFDADRVRKSRYIFILALGVLALLPAHALAAVDGKTLAIEDQVYDDNGDPYLIAAATANSKAKLIWERCAPITVVCDTLPGTTGESKPGKTAAGTTFRVHRYGVADPEYLATGPWKGRVAATSIPTARGSLNAMSQLKLNAGKWTGGWGADDDSVTVFACKRANDSNCDVATGNWLTGGGKQTKLPLGAKYVGWRLYLVNYHDAVDMKNFSVQFWRTRPSPVVDPIATTAIVYLGRLKDDPEYSVRLFGRTHRSGSGSVAIGRAKCPGVCRVRINTGDQYVGGPPLPEWTQRIVRNGILRVPHSAFYGNPQYFQLLVKDALMDSRNVQIAH
jgi:hypothetical protein